MYTQDSNITLRLGLKFSSCICYLLTKYKTCTTRKTFSNRIYVEQLLSKDRHWEKASSFSKMWTSRKQMILGSLVFLGTVTFLMITGDFRLMGLSSNGRRGIPQPKQHDHGCYTITNLFVNKPHPPEVLEERGCSKRLPDVLIIGSKKSGTTTLRNFVAFHPQIAATDIEAHYYDTKRFMGLEWFREQMPYSLPVQLILEKTPRYFVYPDIHSAMKADLRSDIKLILVIRDPVTRAVSDFTHITFKRNTMEKQTAAVLVEAGKPTLSPEQKESRRRFKAKEAKRLSKYPNYDNLGLTFEDSVLTNDGEVDVNSAFVDTGIYVKHMRKWLKQYSRDQILVLDGEEMIVDPYKTMKQVERFLNLQSFFQPEYFHFDMQKGFFCLSKPFYACMKPSKGRPHTSVSDATLDKLRRFYLPLNIELEEMLNQTFSWTLQE